MGMILIGVIAILALGCSEKENPHMDLSLEDTSRYCSELGQAFDMNSFVVESSHRKEFEYGCKLGYRDGQAMVIYSGRELGGAVAALRLQKNVPKRPAFYACSKKAGCYELLSTGASIACMQKCATKTGYKLFGGAP